LTPTPPVVSVWSGRVVSSPRSVRTADEIGREGHALGAGEVGRGILDGYCGREAGAEAALRRLRSWRCASMAL